MAGLGWTCTSSGFISSFRFALGWNRKSNKHLKAVSFLNPRRVSPLPMGPLGPSGPNLKNRFKLPRPALVGALVVPAHTDGATLVKSGVSVPPSRAHDFTSMGLP